MIGSLVSRHHELVLRVSDGEHRTWCYANYSLGNATEQDVRQPGSAVSAQNDQADVVLFGITNDLQKRATLSHFAHHGEILIPG